VVVEAALSTVDHSDIRGSTLMGCAVMVVIRRELPRTTCASWAWGLSHRIYEDSPFRVPLDRHRFRLDQSLPSPRDQAAGRLRFVTVAWALSTWTPIAQMNPSSSRATAVTTCCFTLPLPINRR
jgi:hypothetical protein